MPRRWTGRPANGCTRCGSDFTSTLLFDRHRIGAYEPGNYKGSLADWTPELGRRCLDEDEMEAKGWELNDRGRWVDPVRLHASREAFARAA
jgi:hypothetical protein